MTLQETQDKFDAAVEKAVRQLMDKFPHADRLAVQNTVDRVITLIHRERQDETSRG
jgi:hypothetical protein